MTSWEGNVFHLPNSSARGGRVEEINTDIRTVLEYAGEHEGTMIAVMVNGSRDVRMRAEAEVKEYNQDELINAVLTLERARTLPAGAQGSIVTMSVKDKAIGYLAGRRLLGMHNAPAPRGLGNIGGYGPNGGR